MVQKKPPQVTHDQRTGSREAASRSGALVPRSAARHGFTRIVSEAPFTMCARYTLRTRRVQLEALFGHLDADLQPRFNIAPSQPVLAYRPDAEGKPHGAMLRWGLIPSWAQDEKISHKLINARSETIAEKPSFRSAVKHRRRCLLPADGFYEWRTIGKKKQPLHITRPDGEPFAFAGLWETWDGPAGEVESCTILTTAANPFMAGLHDRMPVIFTGADEFERWLNDEVIDDLLRPLPDGMLAMREVNDIVNNPRHEDPRCVEPPAGERTLFD